MKCEHQDPELTCPRLSCPESQQYLSEEACCPVCLGAAPLEATDESSSAEILEVPLTAAPTGAALQDPSRITTNEIMDPCYRNPCGREQLCVLKSKSDSEYGCECLSGFRMSADDASLCIGEWTREEWRVAADALLICCHQM